MTEDRDFKKVVRERSAKTGESYQAARRQVERKPGGVSAPVHALWAHPEGLVLGCRVEEGQLVRGMPVTVVAGETILHQGTVASLRRGKEDQDVVTSGDCGVLLDPPFQGYRTVEGDATGAEVPFALKPVEMVAPPYRLVG